MDSFDLGLFQSGLVQRLGRNSDTCIDQLDRLGNRSIPCRTGSSFYLNSLRSSGVFGSQVAEGHCAAELAARLVSYPIVVGAGAAAGVKSGDSVASQVQHLSRLISYDAGEVCGCKLQR